MTTNHNNSTASLTSREAREIAISIGAFGAISFAPFVRMVDDDGDGGEVVVWSSRVVDVLTNRAGEFCAEERDRDLVGSFITWNPR